MAVYNKLKKIRNEKHISQEELAAAIRCNSRTISRYETGERYPSLELALRLARYLDLSTDELFTLDKDPMGT